jgi:hypothetical protein
MTLDDYFDQMYYDAREQEIAEIERAERNARILAKPLSKNTIKRLEQVKGDALLSGTALDTALEAAYKMGVADAIK